MSAIGKIKASRVNNVGNVSSYIGEEGILFYNFANGVIRLSDGVTPGGVPVPYTIASNTVIGGIKAGPGTVISNDGVLFIDTANLALSFGNFTADNNVLTITNVDQDMILRTQGNAEIQLIGNIGFYKPDGLPPSAVDRYFYATDDGQVTFYIPDQDPLSAAVKVIGSTSGKFVSPAVTGVMLHVTGQNGQLSSIYSDAVGNNAAFVGRRYNGTAISPTQVLSGNVIMRVTAVGYHSNGFQSSGSGTLSFDALENFTPTAQGTELKIYTTAIGSNARSVVATINNANGVSATQFNTSGNITAVGNITGGNIISGNAIVGNLTVQGNIKFSGINATGSGFNKTGGTVTANGQTGQVTSAADSLAKGSAGTFTINNNYITSDRDVVIVNIGAGGSINAYSIAVTRVSASGFCNVTVTNNGSGPLAEALTFNFAVIKVA